MGKSKYSAQMQSILVTGSQRKLLAGGMQNSSYQTTESFLVLCVTSGEDLDRIKTLQSIFNPFIFLCRWIQISNYIATSLNFNFHHIWSLHNVWKLKEAKLKAFFNLKVYSLQKINNMQEESCQLLQVRHKYVLFFPYCCKL